LTGFLLCDEFELVLDELSFDELSFDELSFDKLSFDELSFDELSFEGLKDPFLARKAGLDLVDLATCSDPDLT
jgi:hypothetical protein